MGLKEMSDLRSFIADLEKTDDIVHVREELSIKYEIPAVLKAFDNGKAVLFEKVAGFPNKIIGGVCGTRERIYRALKIRNDEFYSRLQHALTYPRKAAEAGDGPVKEVVEKPQLTKMPILTHFERDPGPYVTSAAVYARDSEEEIQNVSIHRLQILDDSHFAIRIVPRQLYRLCQMAKERGEKTLDISISAGLHPAVLLAAAAPAPFGVCEFDVANELMDGKLRLIQCEHVDAYAPADAEFVLEGKILLDRAVPEGPFVDLTSTYDI